MKARRFGVEIECGIPELEEKTEGSQGYYDWGTGTYEGPSEEDIIGEFLSTAKKQARISSEWSWVYDGSFIEFQSPILQGPAGFGELKRMMGFIVSAGGLVQEWDGMHVHHDAPEFVNNTDLQTLLVKSWIGNRELIGKFVDQDRNAESLEGQGPCPTWPTLTPQGYLSEIEDQYWRYDLNTTALREHGSVELRLHEGCLDFDRAEAWIRFGQAFLNKVANGKKELPACQDHADLLRRLRVAQKSRERLLARAGSALAATAA
jgi:hypothetical protein